MTVHALLDGLNARLLARTEETIGLASRYCIKPFPCRSGPRSRDIKAQLPEIRLQTLYYNNNAMYYVIYNSSRAFLCHQVMRKFMIGATLSLLIPRVRPHLPSPSTSRPSSSLLIPPQSSSLIIPHHRPPHPPNLYKVYTVSHYKHNKLFYNADNEHL